MTPNFYEIAFDILCNAHRGDLHKSILKKLKKLDANNFTSVELEKILNECKNNEELASKFIITNLETILFVKKSDEEIMKRK